MAEAIYPAGITETHGATLSLSTTVAFWNIPDEGFRQGMVYAPAQDFRMHLNPSILDVFYYDASNSAGSRWENSGTNTARLRQDVTDQDTATGTGTAMDAGATGDRLWVRVSKAVRGLRAVIGSANGNASVLTVKYWNGSTFATITATDGTISPAGTTLGTSGNITWTVPTDWAVATVQAIGETGSTELDAPRAPGLWLELSWGAALSADVEIDELQTMNADTDYGYFRKGMEYVFSADRRFVGCLEVDLASGTDTMEITLWKTG